MTRDEVDIMWQKAMQEAVEDGEMYTRYHFAKFVEDKALAEHAMSKVQRLGQEIEQEPVSWATKEDFRRELERRLKNIREEMKIKSVTMRCKDFDYDLPIIDTDFGRVLVGQVSTSPQRKPLTDEEMKKIWYEMKNIMGWYLFQEIARAIEAAHGIKE